MSKIPFAISDYLRLLLKTLLMFVIIGAVLGFLSACNSENKVQFTDIEFQITNPTVENTKTKFIRSYSAFKILIESSDFNFIGDFTNFDYDFFNSNTIIFHFQRVGNANIEYSVRTIFLYEDQLHIRLSARNALPNNIVTPVVGWFSFLIYIDRATIDSVQELVFLDWL